MIGSTIGRYRVTSALGEGGMGTVWRAEDPLLGRAVALKLLAPHLADSPEAHQRFLREARAASQLDHPCIAAVHDVGEADGRIYIAYQLVEGRTLAARLTEGPLPVPELLRFARLAAEALAHAHARGVLHRDLTARNLMQRPDGSPVIVDFGLARTSGDLTLTRTGTTLGTARYLAPELWRGEPGGTASDLWALGVAWYEAATGQPPFPGETAETVMFHVLNDEPARPRRLRPDLPAGFERVVLRMLEKDVRDRPSSAAEVAAALAAMERELEEPVNEGPRSGESPLALLGRSWRRLARRRVGPLAIALVLALGALGAGAWWGTQWWLEAHRERVLAVLPLRDTSVDNSESAYIAEGLGQELARRLGDAGGFRILPWSTSESFGRTDRTLQSLARELGADVLLTGTFAAEGERITVLAELVDGRTGLQMWSERLVRTTGDLIGLQTALAAAVAEHVARGRDAERAQRIARSTPADPDAYEHFLRGASYLHASDESEKAFALPMFMRAVELDSTLAVAWVGMGAVYTDRHMNGGEGGLANLHAADSCFRRALRIDPDLPEAARGLISLAGEDGALTETALDLTAEALKKGGSSIRSLETAGWGLTFSYPELAVRVLDRVLEMDPNNQSASFYRVLALCWSGDDRRATEAGKAYVRRFGEDAEVYGLVGISLTAMAEFNEAAVFFRRGMELRPMPDFLSGYGISLLLKTGNAREAEARLDTTIAYCRSSLDSYPDNLRVRAYLTTLLTLRGDRAVRDAQVERLVTALDAGARTTGASEPDVPLAMAFAGDVTAARALLPRLPIDRDTWIGWWIETQFAERRATFVSDGTTALLASPEYKALRQKVEALRSRRLDEFRALVNRALTGVRA